MKIKNKAMTKKIILSIIIIAAVSALGYYLYLNVFNNQYELSYKLQKRKDWEPRFRTSKFVGRHPANLRRHCQSHGHTAAIGTDDRLLND